MDILSIGGLIAAFTTFLVAFKMEGGELPGLLQITAFMIVVGGTWATVLISFSMSTLKKLPKSIRLVFFDKPTDPVAVIDKLAEYSDSARRTGLLELESKVQQEENRLMKKGLELVIDGMESETVADILYKDAELEEKENHECASVWEAAGGYSPTMGIIGTVMGLITVLNNLSEPETLGHSIAVAFVATLYGVCFANVIYLAFASKIKARGQKDALVAEIIIEGVLSIQAGENPKIMKEKLCYNLIKEYNPSKGGDKSEAKTASSEEDN